MLLEMRFQKPARLREGDTVAVVSPSSGLPIVTNLDFGHTDPQLIMPLGVKAEIDPEKKSFRLLESPVEWSQRQKTTR